MEEYPVSPGFENMALTLTWGDEEKNNYLTNTTFLSLNI